MLELTNGGRCCSGLDAVEFFERLADALPDHMTDPEFCEEYEDALNRLRYLVAQAQARPPKWHGPRIVYYTCPQCGHTLHMDGTDKWCPNCGQTLDWATARDWDGRR